MFRGMGERSSTAIGSWSAIVGTAMESIGGKVS